MFTLQNYVDNVALAVKILASKIKTREIDRLWKYFETVKIQLKCVYFKATRVFFFSCIVYKSNTLEQERNTSTLI